MENIDIGVEFEKGTPTNDLHLFQESIATEGLTVRLRERESFGPLVMIEWFIPATVVIYIAKSYFTGFLREAGKDHYKALRRHLPKTASKVMKLPRIEPTITATTGKAVTDNPYSLALSIHAEANDGSSFKLLLPKLGQQSDDYETIVAKFLDFLYDFHGSIKIDPNLGDFESTGRPGSIVLVHYNHATEAIEYFDYRQFLQVDREEGE